MGSDYWQPVVDFIRGKMVSEGTIDAHDAQLFTFTDSPETAASRIRDSVTARFGLELPKPVKPHWILGEHGRQRIRKDPST